MTRPHKDVPVRISAVMATPISGSPPHLDALLEWILATRSTTSEARGPAILSKGDPAPTLGAIPIPIKRIRIGAWPVAKCSSPVVISAMPEGRENFAKRIDSALFAALLDPAKRRGINQGSGPTKAYYKPMRVIPAREIVWFALAFGEVKDGTGRRRSPIATLRRRLKEITHIGGKRSAGYGHVARWEIEEIDDDFSWTAPSEYGPVLMRPMPAAWKAPDRLMGAFESYGACCPPYWHPDRYTDILEPI